MTSSDKVIITISREYGSGGRYIGKKVADKLGIAYWDRELVSRASEESGISEDLFEKDSEQVSNRFAYLFSFASGASTGEADTLPVSDRIFLAQAKLIKRIASESSCVIVGRCADYILADEPDIMNVYIHAAWDSRVHRVMEREKLAEAEAVALIKKTDKARESYYQHYTDRKWGRAENYDLCLSSDKLGIDGTVDVIMHYLDVMRSSNHALTD